MPSSPSSAARTQPALAVLLLLLMAVLAGGAAIRESITVDEVAHLGAGVSYLQKLDLRMNEEHPPLAKVLAAAPLVVRGVHADYSDLSWTFSESIFRGMLGEWSWGHSVAMRWNDPRSTLLWGRAPMLLLTLALGLVLYIFGSKLGNAWGGLLSLAAYASTPAFLVFGPLILTDIAVTLFCVLTIWALADMWRTPNRGTMIRFAVAFAAALLSKFSSGLLLFGALAFALSLRWLPLPGQPTDRGEFQQWRRVRRRHLWKGILGAALIVYGVYFILSWNQPTDSLQLLGGGFASLVLRRLLIPPWLYFRGFVMFLVTSSRGTFILGHSHPHGVWFYFPVLFVLKSTLAFLALLLLAATVALVAKRRLPGNSVIPQQMAFHWRALWTFLIVFVGACLLSRLNLSIRHFTVPIALMILALAPLPRVLELLKQAGWPAARVAAGLAALLALASLATAIRAYPLYFPFLNSLSFGRPGYTLVNDSNLDWNQALPDAERFVREHGVKDVLLDEYGFSDPTIYVPDAEFWTCQQPAPSDGGRWAIVSASMIEDGHNCLWLLNYPHESFAGGGMYAFQLPATIPPAGSPGGPPLPADYHAFGGTPGNMDFRLMFYNCIRDPKQLQPFWDRMMAMFANYRKKK
ncbi:MAG TPA: glycosyltransferase family 39 protein [Candidatus Acidoferrum sp.]|nr:glycosyltransferase family 39 protein [Candidatus Acidoferrum sp.]